MKLRRILSIILSLVMLLGLMPMAYAAEGNSAVLGEVGGMAGVVAPVGPDLSQVVDFGYCGDGILWFLDNSGNLFILGSGSMDDYSDTGSGRAPWYSERSSIKAVEISSGITHIGEYAFYNCNYIQRVELPEGIISVGEAAFKFCYAITSLELPESLTDIGAEAFHNCRGLSSITIPGKVAKIGFNTFYNCSGLKNIYFEGKAPVIYSDSFFFVTATVTYPANDSTWENIAGQNYGGSLTWVTDDHSHSYTATITAPTCTEQGYTTYTCACGDSYTDSYTEADTLEGHDYVGGVCSLCGHSVLGADWLAPDFAQGDYTMVALPDTQNMVKYWPKSFYRQTSWVADNKDSLNIKAVMHMGDMVNDDTAAQWDVIKTGMDIIDASGIAWMPMRGNHDPSIGFNAAFPYDTYGTEQSWFGGSYHDGTLDHTYWFVTVGQREYLIFSLGWAPSWEVLGWVKDIAAAHPDKSVILTTHALMAGDGSFLDEGESGVGSYLPGYPNSSFIKAAFAECDNLVLAMCGHVHSENIIVRSDLNGADKVMSSMLLDYQNKDVSSPHGVVALLTFHEDSDQVDVNWYSTYYDALYRSKNQFSISVPHVHEHSYEELVTPPTCTEQGYTTYTCSCGDSYKGNETAITDHSWDEGVITTEPTETTDGVKTFTCTVCGDTKTGTVPSANHKHSYIETVTAPTCTEKGYTTYTCSCGDSYKDSYTEALGHLEVLVAAVAPTCTETGFSESKNCSRCEEVLKAQTVVPALGHSRTKDAAVAPSCTETGLTEGEHCSACKLVLKAQATVPALGHNRVVDAAVLPTCTENGLSAGSHCSRCDVVFEAQMPIGAYGHSIVEDAAVVPTCTTSGISDGEHCEYCGEVFREQKIIDALGHIEIIDENIAPDCINTGLSEGKHCERCSEVLVAQVEVDALGHDEVKDAAVAPTCTETGLTEGSHCSRCKEVFAAQTVLEALGHEEVKDEAAAPDCSNTGLTEGSHCSRCEEVFKAQETVAALGHKWGKSEITKKPTVDAEGEKTYTCTECGEKMTEKLEKLPGCNGKHTWDEGTLTKEPTNKEEGEMSYACSVCGETKTEKVARLPDVSDFKDVAQKAYYYESVKWALEEGITTGTAKDKFSPSAICTRAQVVTFLWRAAGEPVARNTPNPFSDVKEGEYYYDAVLWALENGITGGVSKDLFAPDAPCTRAQVVTFLWRAAGEPEPDGSKNPFADVTEGQYYYDAVLWAVEQGITKGVTLEAFGPEISCTRAQIVTFLWRAFNR